MRVLQGPTCRCCVLILLAGAFLFLLTMPASAQLPTGTILGVVKDSSGAVVPGAAVTIQSIETNQTRKAVTDSSGAYRVPALPVGHYKCGSPFSAAERISRASADLSFLPPLDSQ